MERPTYSCQHANMNIPQSGPDRPGLDDSWNAPRFDWSTCLSLVSDWQGVCTLTIISRRKHMDQHFMVLASVQAGQDQAAERLC